MGFRGEALASIAAVAQVELRTRRAEDELGVCIDIENSVVTKQQLVAAPVGTSICMKNLFFNVPARRNFLKSNAAEMRHIVDEFIRVAMAFPGIFFSLTSSGQQLFYLESGSLKQRILQILGNNYNARIVSVKEETDYLNIHGFAGKPETAKKTRGDQYFFVNNRFIKSGYLNHALQTAYQDMIPSDSFPMYVLFIDLDPRQVDVNVHPTKQEIKFEDEKIVYAFVQAAVKHALAQFSITPTLDFELDSSIQQLESVQKPFTEEKQSATKTSSIFQTFTEANQAHKIDPENKTGWKHWTELEGQPSLVPPDEPPGYVHSLLRTLPSQDITDISETKSFLNHSLFAIQEEITCTQLFNTYILVPSGQGFLLIHQQSAHERIIYERIVRAMKGHSVVTQKSLFPATIDLTQADAVLLNELLPDLQKMGYSIEPFGKTAFVIHGTPADISQGNEKTNLEKMLEQYKHFTTDLKLSKREMLMRTVSWQQAIKAGTALTQTEMQNLITELFQCQQPNSTPSGRPTYMEFRKEQMDKMFGR
jgi:DNA mismatch repair protein MutL